MLLFKLDFRVGSRWWKDIVVNLLRPKYKHNGYTTLYNNKGKTYNAKLQHFEETYDVFYKMGRYNNVFYFYIGRKD